MTFPVPAALLDLVARFREQLPDYKRGQYNETQLRRDFLDPLGNNSISLFLRAWSNYRHGHS